MSSDVTTATAHAAGQAQAGDELSLSVSLLFATILAAMILALALEEKLHANKSVIVGLFAVLCLVLAAFMGLLPFGAVTLADGHQVKLPEFIPSIDWGVTHHHPRFEHFCRCHQQVRPVHLDRHQAHQGLRRRSVDSPLFITA